jgi:PAS domain S-box-containing protein
MMRRSVAVGIGIGMLLLIGAGSMTLDLKSRHDAAEVNHTLKVLQDTSELRVQLRRAEAAARGYALTNAQNFAEEFQTVKAQIPDALAELQRLVSDNSVQVERLGSIEELIRERLAASGELVRLQAASDQAGIAALSPGAEGSTTMAAISAQFDAFTDEEKQLLAVRSQTSRTTSSLLLAADLSGVALILAIAAYLIRSDYRSNRALRTSLSRSRAETSSLEARAQQQEHHLVAAYENLRHSSDILESTFNSMSEGVLVIEPDGEIVRSNETITRFLGTRPGKTFAEMKVENRFFESDGATPIADSELPIARTLRGEAFDRKEVVVKPTDGRPNSRLLVSGRPLRDGDNAVSGAAMIYHDITDAHETERLLQQAQKLDAIGKLTGGVAHDFNNMLTIITGSIEVLIDQIRDRPATAELAGLIGRAADRCTELIRHLLAFARKQPLRPRDIDVNSTVLDIAKLLRPTLGEQIEINSILDEEVLVAHVDSAQLANSLVNLAINARDAMPDGGKLLLETRKMVLDEAYAAANAGVAAGTYIMVAVSDTGTGMPAEVRDRAFEPFFTTKEAGKGSGLGLSMVYGFARQSGGHVKIYSEEGRGTTIRLYMPPAKAAVQTEAMPEGPIPQGTETILVVEDERLVREFVVNQLDGLGYTTRAVSNGAEALEAVTAGESFDLLFTDVIMPGGINGKELADEITRLRPHTRVLFTSGYTDNAIIEHGRLEAGARLLTKPYRRSELAQMVYAALHERTKDPVVA